MKHRRKLLLLMIAVLSSSQGVCSTISYRLTTDNNKQQCKAFLDALEHSRLARMSDQQFCSVMNSNVPDLLKDPNINGINWTPLTSGEVKTIDVVKKLFESRVGSAYLARFPKSELSFVSDFEHIAAGIDLVLEQASLQVGQRTVYALQLRRKQCNSTYKGNEGLPLWGLFSDQAHSMGVESHPYTPNGNLFYLRGRLVALSITPERWYPDSNLTTQNNKLNLNVQSVDGAVDANGEPALVTENVCTVIIHR